MDRASAAVVVCLLPTVLSGSCSFVWCCYFVSAARAPRRLHFDVVRDRSALSSSTPETWSLWLFTCILSDVTCEMMMMMMMMAREQANDISWQFSGPCPCVGPHGVTEQPSCARWQYGELFTGGTFIPRPDSGVMAPGSRKFWDSYLCWYISSRATEFGTVKKWKN